jgi:hypothetical protein
MSLKLLQLKRHLFCLLTLFVTVLFVVWKLNKFKWKDCTWIAQKLSEKYLIVSSNTTEVNKTENWFKKASSKYLATDHFICVFNYSFCLSLFHQIINISLFFHYFLNLVLAYNFYNSIKDRYFCIRINCISLLSFSCFQPRLPKV